MPDSAVWGLAHWGNAYWGTMFPGYATEQLGRQFRRRKLPLLPHELFLQKNHRALSLLIQYLKMKLESYGTTEG